MKNGTLCLTPTGAASGARRQHFCSTTVSFIGTVRTKDTDTHNRSVDFVGFSCYKAAICCTGKTAVLCSRLSMRRDTTCTRTASVSAPACYITQKRKNLCCGFIWITAAILARRGRACRKRYPTGPFAHGRSQRPGSHDSRDFTAFQDKGRQGRTCSARPTGTPPCASGSWTKPTQNGPAAARKF